MKDNILQPGENHHLMYHLKWRRALYCASEFSDESDLWTPYGDQPVPDFSGGYDWRDVTIDSTYARSSFKRSDERGTKKSR